MPYPKALFALTLSLLFFVSTAQAQDKKAPPPPPGGFPKNQGIPKNSKAPDFKYQSLNNKEIKLSNYRGQYVLIDFWGTWCKPCLKEIPYLKKAYSKYGKDIKFISIAADNNKQAVINYVSKNDIKWTQIAVPLNAESPAKIIEEYNVHLYPSVYLIDPNGIVQHGAQSRKENNKLSGNELLKTMDKILNK